MNFFKEFTEIFGIQKSLTDLQRQYNEELGKTIGASEAEKANLQSCHETRIVVLKL